MIYRLAFCIIALLFLCFDQGALAQGLVGAPVDHAWASHWSPPPPRDQSLAIAAFCCFSIIFVLLEYLSARCTTIWLPFKLTVYLAFLGFIVTASLSRTYSDHLVTTADRPAPRAEGFLQNLLAKITHSREDLLWFFYPANIRGRVFSDNDNGSSSRDLTTFSPFPTKEEGGGGW